MSERDDGVRGDHPGGVPRPRRNGLLPDDSANSAFPTDLAAVQADDALLDALRGPNPPAEGSDARLTQVLLAWRREVDSEPVTRLMDTDTALAVVARARRPAPRRNATLVPFAAAAAVLVIAFSGVGFGARAAEPGDRLFPLTQILYTNVAESKVAKARAREQLQQASDLLAQGRVREAEIALARARGELRAVDDAGSRAQLQKEVAVVSDELGDQGGTDDGAAAANSRDSGSAPAQESPPPLVESPPDPEDPPAEEPQVPSAPGPTDPDSPADSGPGAGGTGGENPGTSPRFAPPPPPPPESFPGS